MSHALASPSHVAAARRWLARAWSDPDTRSVTIGIIGVLLVHWLLWLLTPLLLRFDASPIGTVTAPTTREFSIEIQPDPEAEAQPKPVPPQQFVETNPDAPENTPDRTNNFGAQNQQVAQEKATPNGASERPALEGKKDFDSTQIVSGRLKTLQERMEAAAAAAAEMPPTPPTTAAPRAEQNPLPGFEKSEGDNPDGFGTTVAPNAANPRPIPERIEGTPNAPIVDGATGLQPVIDPKRPRPRPQIVQQQQVRPAILAENKLGTKNIGPVAINAKFNDYGLYLQRLVDTVQMEFDRLADQASAYPPAGSHVVVRFALNREGNVARIVNVESHTTTVGAQIAVSSITNRAPFGPWTEAMRAVLSEEEELVFTFYYQ